MSETLSQLPAGATGALSDLVPITQGSTGPLSGTTRKVSTGKVLGSNGLIYAGDPAYGVVANGSTDDTAAWNLALTAAGTLGGWVVAPMGVSVVSSITIPGNVGIIGRSVESSLAGAGGGSETLGSVIQGTSVTSAAIIMSPYSQLSSIQVSGNNSQPCVRPYVDVSNNGYVQIWDVDCFGGSIGIDFNSTGKFSLVGACRIHECGVGISNGLAVRIVNSFINNCTTHGISLAKSCNRNVIVGNRLEWNGSNNLNMDGTGGSLANNVVTGNSFDAAGANNVYMKNCHYQTVAGNDLGRAGRNQGGSPGSSSDATIQMVGCVGVIVTGNSSWVSNSDGAGYTGPYWAVYDGGTNTNCAITSNILAFNNNSGGSTVGPINITSTFNLAASLNQAFWASTD